MKVKKLPEKVYVFWSQVAGRLFAVPSVNCIDPGEDGVTVGTYSKIAAARFLMRAQLEPFGKKKKP